MAQFEEQYTQDLTQGIKIRQCGNIVFNGDNLSNVIRVSLYNGTTPATLSGTVVGAVICSDGSTVPVDNGTISGNTVTLTLTQACFAISGQIGVGIQIVSGTTKTTIFKGIYNVERLTTENVIDPSERITLEVSDLIDDIADALATIPADYTDLMAAVAPIFDTSTAYSTGAYVWYEGTLYQFKNDHASGSWDSSQVIAATVPAFPLIDFVGTSTPFDITFTLGKNISNGSITNSNYTALSNFLPTSPTFIRTGADTDGNGVALSMFVHEYDSTQTWLRRTALNATDGKIMHPQSDCAYVRIVFGRASSTGISIAQSDIDNYFGINTLTSMQQIVSELDKIGAQVLYTALMTDTILEGD